MTSTCGTAGHRKPIAGHSSARRDPVRSRMDKGGERSLKEKLAFHIVRLKIQQIFEECSKFDESDKKALYEVIGNLLLQRIGAAETPSPADEAPPVSTELTDAAPTDDSTSSSKMSGPPMVDVNAAFPK